MAKKNDFPDYFDAPDDFDLSDGELDALLAQSLGEPAASAATDATDQLDPGERVTGTVVGPQGKELLLELDRKSYGVVDLSEFGADVPVRGEKIAATYLRYDDERDMAILAVAEVRREIFWEELHEGEVLEGVAIAENKGGLTLDIHGTRAFLPISHIERGRVEDASVYIGQKLRVAVVSFNRTEKDLVVSRRQLLDQEWEATQQEAILSFGVGDEVLGTVVRLNAHGAFIDVGGVEGLLHSSKLRASRHADATELQEGQQVRVQITHVDAAAGRMGLDLCADPLDSWVAGAEAYEVGEEATCLIRKVTSEGAEAVIDETIAGWIPAELVTGSLRAGSLCRAVVTGKNEALRRIELRPLS